MDQFRDVILDIIHEDDEQCRGKYTLCDTFLLLLSIPFLYFKKKSGTDKLTEWSTIPVCPSLMCFSTGAITKELIL